MDEGLLPIEFHAHRAKLEVEELYAGRTVYFKSGFTDLDQLWRGVPGDLTIVAARPSMGKTAFALQLAENICAQLDNPGHCVAIFSAEMTGVSLVKRMACARASVEMSRLDNGECTVEELGRVYQELERLNMYPIEIDDGSRPRSSDLRSRLAELHKSRPVRMMLFDFMELMGDENHREEQRISWIARNLKQIAKDVGIPVVAISQLNRDVENRANKMPQLSDLRQSGMIEQVADNVLFLMRPEYYLERGMECDIYSEVDRAGICYVQQAKGRNRPTGVVRLGWNGRAMRFYSVDITRVDLNPPGASTPGHTVGVAARKKRENPLQYMKPLYQGDRDE